MLTRKQVHWLQVAGSILLVSGASGCAHIFKGDDRVITVDSDPQQTKVLLNGVAVGKTPIRLKVSTDKDHVITLQRDGYAEQKLTLTRQLLPGYVIVDVIATGLIGVVVDASTGAWFDVVPRDLRFQMLPKDGPSADSPAPESAR